MNRPLVFKAGDYDNFSDIKTGLKSIETRAGTGPYQKIKKGDILTITCRGEVIRKTVNKIEHFRSVQDVFDSPDFEKILPGVSSLKEAESIYYGFTGYKEKIAKYGLLAFYLD